MLKKNSKCLRFYFLWCHNYIIGYISFNVKSQYIYISLEYACLKIQCKCIFIEMMSTCDFLIKLISHGNIIINYSTIPHDLPCSQSKGRDKSFFIYVPCEYNLYKCMVKGRVNCMYIKCTHMAHWQVKKNN